MTNKELELYGIETVEDGYMTAHLRDYYFKGVKLDLTHSKIKSLTKGKLAELIFDAGRENIKIYLREFLGISDENEPMICDGDY